MGVSRTSRSLSQRQRNFANIYTHTGLARILKEGKINTKIDPKMAKIGKLPKIHKLPKIRKCRKSSKGIKRSAVMLESPTKKRCVINLWREKSELISNIGK